MLCAFVSVGEAMVASKVFGSWKGALGLMEAKARSSECL